MIDPLTPYDPGSRQVLRGAAGGTVLDGLTLPLQPCRAVEDGSRAALWLGPSEWLLLGLEAPSTEFALVDVTDRQIGFRLVGAGAATLLAFGVPLDLAEAAFPIGMCTRTLFEKVEITLWRRGADSWHIEVFRSFTPYLCEMIDVISAANRLA